MSAAGGHTPPIPRAVANGWIVLMGGGDFSFGQTREIDEFLISKLPQDRRRIAFLPTASGSQEYAGHLGNYFTGLGSDIELINIPVYRPRDARRGKNLDLIRSAPLIYLGGGVTNLFLETIGRSPAEAAMREAVHGGATLAAIGAAAASLGQFARDMRRSGAAIPGLAWLPGSVVEAGFDPSNDRELRRLMSIPQVRLGLGIPPQAALALGPDGTGEILGAGQIALVRKPSVQ
jgi:cyanophycinase-like exopeptidase